MRGQRNSVLFRTIRLLEGVNAFAFAGTVLVAGLFALGNYQEFLDGSQSMLLILVSFLSLLAVATGLSYVGSLIIWMIRRRRTLILRLLYGIVATAICAAFAVGIGLLQSAVRAA